MMFAFTSVFGRKQQLERVEPLRHPLAEPNLGVTQVIEQVPLAHSEPARDLRARHTKVPQSHDRRVQVVADVGGDVAALCRSLAEELETCFEGTR